MEKLIKLLNEYKIYTDHEKSRMSEYVWDNVGDDIVMSSYIGTTKDKTLEIISKKFGFIKWLVDNDKVDLLRLDNRITLSEFNKVERVLMALSISENPIEFLISILK